jgi:hypothetical protein
MMTKFYDGIWIGDNRINWLCSDVIVRSDNPEKKKLSSEFLRWGIKQAQRDKVPSFVMTLERDRALYEEEGFERLDGVTFRGWQVSAMHYVGRDEGKDENTDESKD